MYFFKNMDIFYLFFVKIESITDYKKNKSMKKIIEIFSHNLISSCQ